MVKAHITFEKKLHKVCSAVLMGIWISVVNEQYMCSDMDYVHCFIVFTEQSIKTLLLFHISYWYNVNFSIIICY